MKMDENKKIFPIFIENKGEHKEILEYTHSPKEQPLSCIMATGATTPVRPQSYIMAPFGRPYKEEVLLEPKVPIFGCPYKEDAVLSPQSIVEIKKRRREVFERTKQNMEETE